MKEKESQPNLKRQTNEKPNLKRLSSEDLSVICGGFIVVKTPTVIATPDPAPPHLIPTGGGGVQEPQLSILYSDDIDWFQLALEHRP